MVPSRLTLGLVLLLLGAARAGSAREAALDAKPPLVFGSGVSVVSVPVFVADRDGHALRGLGPEDFEIYDDGKRAPIVSFQYVDTTSDEEQAAIREAPAARRHFLLLFDMSFTDVGGLHRARLAAQDFILHRLAESDLVAVATFDIVRGIRLIANFTEDRGLVAHAVNTLGVPGLAQISDPLSLARNITATDLSTGAGTRSGEEKENSIQEALASVARRLRSAESEIYRQQVKNLIGNLDDLGRSLRSVEGRKQIVYFSAGFDSQALVGNFGEAMRNDSESLVAGHTWEVEGINRYGDSLLRDVFAKMTQTLSSSDCVVHAVDLVGLARNVGVREIEASRDMTRDVAGRQSLNFMSSETGGRFFKDTNDLKQVMGEVADMTSRYYILGYQPEDLRGPGRFHKLKVKVLRKGGKVSHRAGYYERTPRSAQTALQRKFESAQLVMTGLGPTDLHFTALCLPFPGPGDTQTLGLVLQVPKQELRWDAPLSLEVYGYAVGSDGSTVDHLAQLAHIDPVQADPGRTADGVSFFGTFHVPPGQYTLKLMIQESGGGSAGVVFLDVAVPPYDPRAGFLLPPVVMDDLAKWVGLEMGSGKAGRGEFPFQAGGKRFLPRSSFRVTAGVPEKLALIAYDATGPADSASSGLEIQSSVTDKQGTAVAPGLLKLDRVHREGGGRRTYVLSYTPDPLPAGDYTLRIGIAEAGSRLESYALLKVGPAQAASR